MSIELITAALFLGFAASAIGWFSSIRRLAESRRERKDLANSSLVIEEERRVLELVAKGASLQEVLDTLTRAIERISAESICTVLLLDEEKRKFLLKGSGPSLPPEYLQAVNGLEIGPEVGACGSAAFRNEDVVVEDIATDHRFAPARDFVMSFGLRSCWSVPIRDSRGEVLGTFAMYRRRPSFPRPEELRLVRAAAQLGGNAIERLRAEQVLFKTAERLKLAEKVAQFGIWEADFEKGTITISAGTAALMGLIETPLCLRMAEFEAAIYPDDVATLRASLASAMAGDGTFQNEFRFVLPGGAIRWQRNRGQLNFENDKARRATGALTDITEEKSMLVRLQEAQAAAESAARAAREAERLEQDRKTILELVAKDKPLDQIAVALARAVASHIPASLCSIQLEFADAAPLSISPHFPEQMEKALHRLPIASIRETVSAEPITNLSSDPGWQYSLPKFGAFSSSLYRAVPIMRNGRTTGLIISFFDEAGEERTDEKLLESWSQFASLAVERRGLYEQLSFRAQHDHLTTLLNRASLYDCLNAEIQRSAREGVSMAVVYLDLDYFKEINDRFGHGAGDLVLQHVSSRILESIRHTDIAARIGGDEFVVVLPGVGDRTEADRISHLMMDAIRQPVSFHGVELRVGASFGTSIYPDNGNQTEALLKMADEDMYRAKLRRRKHLRQDSDLETVAVPASASLSQELLARV